MFQVLHKKLIYPVHFVNTQGQVCKVILNGSELAFVSPRLEINRLDWNSKDRDLFCY